MPTEDRLVGILGGMGPKATVDFYGKLVDETPATNDHEHVRVAIWADPTVPSRTNALLSHGVDPTPWLIDGAKRLERLGAGVIAVPCNTAHAFLPRVAEGVGVPILDMIEEACAECRATLPRARSVALLATTATLRAELYQRQLAEVGLDVLVPDQNVQDNLITQAILRIKSGDYSPAVTAMVLAACQALLDRGAEVVIAGCTELPLVIRAAELGVPLIDPTRSLAKAAVAWARGGAQSHADKRISTAAPHS